MNRGQKVMVALLASSTEHRYSEKTIPTIGAHESGTRFWSLMTIYARR